MSEIRLLDSSVINLIAAGEVVDRSASAVKEMVENAIDAGATRISVEIRRGGLELIRISDDGCGMTAENAKRAFLKHATSKISTQEDLYRISTLGFRGEALAAISAVSKITLTTKPADQLQGTRLEITEGKILSEEECGCPDGSVFTVENMFFNTPARLKFMKSEMAEAGAVQTTMERLALSHPQVSFRLNSNGSERLYTTGRGDLTETVYSVFGKEFAEMSLKTDTNTDGIRVYGIVGKPIFSRANRSRQIFFLNGRYVRSPILASGLENAYHNKMLIGRVPVCVLFVELDPSKVDVNVHPSKLEVKFSDENKVSYAVRRATEEALNHDSGILTMNVPTAAVSARIQEETQAVSPKFVKVPAVKVNVEKPSPTHFEKKENSKPVLTTEKSGWVISPPAPRDLHTKFPEPVTVRDSVTATVPLSSCQATFQVTITPPVKKPEAVKQSELEKTEVIKTDPVPAISPNITSPVQEEPILFHTEQAFSIIGEAFGCYILVEKGDEILFVDKHALHERINFEKLRKSNIASQSLLHPIILNFGSEENHVLTENADFLARFGFILESFNKDLLIREIPALIDPEQTEPLLQRFADSLALSRDDTLMDQLYYDIACKASIRSGSKTTRQELQSLIEEYFRREKELQYCPHGRPVVFSLTKKAVEKQFKRLK